MKKQILFQDTSFRDGFQSVFGARVLTDDFIAAVEAAAHAGITHFEAGGGARFQSLFMYCGESAFDMMDRFRAAAGPDAKLQTLSRGINVVALSAQPRDMIDLHARMFAKHGITHIRNFDALNDVRNLEYSGQCIAKAGLHHQVVVTMMELPEGCTGAHDAPFYMKTLQKILDSGLPFDSVCFKEASGTSNPRKIHETIKGARRLLGEEMTIWIHSHDTAGIGVTQYLAAIEAGANGVCVARTPVSGGTSQPDLLAMWHALKGTNYVMDLDPKKILEANAVFQESMADYFFPPEALKLSPEVIFSPMPGGALTANTMMMRDTGTLQLYPKVIEEMAFCIEKGGFGTSVTPVSQFYFQQAYANVTQGRWKKITDGYGKMVLGYFGRTPVEPDQTVVRIAEEQLKLPVFTGDPLDVIEPGIPQADQVLQKEGLPVTDENRFIVGALATPGGNKGLDFLKGNYAVNVRKKEEANKPRGFAVSSASRAGGRSLSGRYKVTFNGQAYSMEVEEENGAAPSKPKPAAAAPKQAAAPLKAQQSAPKGEEPPAVGELPVGPGAIEVNAQLPANVYRVAVKPGDDVKRGDVLVVLEAMKMETQVTAPKDGKIAAVRVAQGNVVSAGQVLAVLSPLA